MTFLSFEPRDLLRLGGGTKSLQQAHQPWPYFEPDDFFVVVLEVGEQLSSALQDI